LRDNDFRFIERLLYDYVTHETAINELERELSDLLESLMPSPRAASMSDMPGIRDSEIASEPEKYAIRIDEHLYVKYLRRHIKERRCHQSVILRAREALNDEEMWFVELFYDQNRTARDCKRIMSYGKSKIYDLRQKVVNKVARYLGII